jgi:rfaE bifunctional protein kinase chain/domain
LNFSVTRLQAIFDRFRDKRILVLGDVMIDEYLRGNVARLSPEAPVPIVEIEDEERRLGGAANVALNVKTLGAEPLLLGVIGKDGMGSRFRELLQQTGMDASAMVEDEARPTTVKTRIIGDNQHIARVDKEQRTPVSGKTLIKILERLNDMVRGVDAIIIEDYNKGVLLPEVIEHVLQLGIQHEKIITVDPKFVNFMSYKGATVFKPNIKETSAALAREIISDEDVDQAGLDLLDQLDVDCVLLTRGSRGISIFEAGGHINHIPTKAKHVADVSGAGDTVISTMTVALTGNASFLEAAALANIAAGIVCEEVGIVPVELEILKKITLNSIK